MVRLPVRLPVFHHFYKGKHLLSLPVCCVDDVALFLTLKAPITTAADDIHKYFFIVFFFFLFLEKIRLDILCESSARQRIHMKHQTLFFLKIKVKIISVVCCKFLFGFKG